MIIEVGPLSSLLSRYLLSDSVKWPFMLRIITLYVSLDITIEYVLDYRNDKMLTQVNLNY